ncbi:MAG: glycosyltransferase family 4 protein [Candidatus Diapherotrites archaeon]
MKVIVIGPIKPFRGGISHSNTITCTTLSKKHKVKVISFKRLFPKLLFPGRFQKEKVPQPNINIEWIIDTLNPFSWVKAVKLIEKEKPDIVIFQWWTTFLAPCYYFIARKIKGKTKISAITHHVLPQQETGRNFYVSFVINKFLTKMFFRQIDNFLVRSNADKNKLLSLMPHAKVECLIEQTFLEEFKPKKKVSKKQAREKIGLKEEKNLLFFGFIRSYKGLRYLLEAMPLILKKHDVKLMIVGEFWENKNEYLKKIEKLGIKEKILIVDKYVSNEEAVLYFTAADAVVIPHTYISESGIIQLAYALNTPIIATKVGGNPDFIENKKTGLLVEPKNPKKLAEAIDYFYSNNLEKKFKKAMKKKEKIFKWSKEKEKILLGAD